MTLDLCCAWLSKIRMSSSRSKIWIRARTNWLLVTAVKHVLWWPNYSSWFSIQEDNSRIEWLYFRFRFYRFKKGGQNQIQLNLHETDIILILKPSFDMTLFVDFWFFPHSCLLWSWNCFALIWKSKQKQFSDHVAEILGNCKKSTITICFQIEANISKL